MKSVFIYVFVFMFFFPTKSFSWGSEGHRVMSRVTSENLNSIVKDSLKVYLGDLSLEDCSVWMDEIRSNHSFDYLKPCHYINIEKGEVYSPSNQENIINELNIVIDRLKHRNLYTTEEVITDIKILVHLIGDLHQPLHTRLNIREKLKVISPILYAIFEEAYKTQIRNSIAHSNYSFSNRVIGLNNFIKEDPHSQLKGISFNQWIDLFHSTIVLHNEYVRMGTVINDHYVKVANQNGNVMEILVTENGGKQYPMFLECGPIWKDWRYKQI